MDSTNSEDLDFSWIKEGPKYNATAEDMENPGKLIQKLMTDPRFKNKAVLVIPPSDYKPTIKSESEILNTKLSDVYNQTISKLVDGYYHFLKGKNSSKKFQTVRDLKKGAGRPKQLENAEFSEIEKAAWKEIRNKGDDKKAYKHLSHYGSDEEGSFMDPHSKKLTLANLPSILSKVMTRYQAVSIGLTVPMTYFGRWLCFFVDHKEDKDLAAFNYLHFGDDKVWYTRDSNDALKFEESMLNDLKTVLKKELHSCETPPRHKCILVDLQTMKRNNIKVFRHVQKAGTFMFVPPGAYHSGWNLGFNVAESVNVACTEWIEWGLFAKACDQSIKPTLKMEFFVYEFMYERYHEYLHGNLKLVNPTTGELELVAPPPIDDVNSDKYSLQSSPVDAILAAKIVHSIKKVYVNFQETKVWINYSQLSQFKWSLTGQPVIVTEDFFSSLPSHPSDFIVNGVRLYRNIIPGGPINFDASPIKVTVNPETSQAPLLRLPNSIKIKKRRVSSAPSINSALLNLNQCAGCTKDLSGFKGPSEQRRHIRNCLQPCKIPCNNCSLTFTRQGDLTIHEKSCFKTLYKPL